MSGKTRIFLHLRELRRSDVGPHLPLQGAFGLLMRDIFGGKYRYISGRALPKGAAKRYANVEQMQKAFKRTHSIPLVAAAVLLFLATLTPYFFIPQQSDNRADELKELSEDMDEALKTATDRFLNRMDEIRFWEFACIEANGLMQEYWSIRGCHSAQDG